MALGKGHRESSRLIAVVLTAIVALISLSPAAQAQSMSPTSCDSCAAMRTAFATIRPIKGQEARQANAIDNGYKALERFAKEFRTARTQPPEAATLLSLELTYSLLMADPSAYAAEVLLPLYRTHRGLFDSAISRMPAQRRSLIQRHLNNADVESAVGNG